MAIKRFPIARLPCPECGCVLILTKRYDLRLTGEGKQRKRQKKKEAEE